MRFKVADDLKLRPREWSILRYLLSQFPNGHLFEALYKRILLCLLNEKYVNWLYFYEYISSFEKPKQRLPNEKKFYIFLKSKEKCDKSTNTFLRFCKLPNEDDEKLSQLVLYVTDVFKISRNSCLKNHEFCLSHYLSASPLCWHAILSLAKVELELISVADRYLFFEKGKRGGVSYNSTRYSKSNNKYLRSCDLKQ